MWVNYIDISAAYSKGNRTSLIERDTQTTNRYDDLDRLIEAKELNNSQAKVRSYNYDKRGNQTNEYVDGLLNKIFTFDATKRNLYIRGKY